MRDFIPFDLCFIFIIIFIPLWFLCMFYATWTGISCGWCIKVWQEVGGRQECCVTFCFIRESLAEEKEGKWEERNLSIEKVKEGTWEANKTTSRHSKTVVTVLSFYFLLPKFALVFPFSFSFFAPLITSTNWGCLFSIIIPVIDYRQNSKPWMRLIILCLALLCVRDILETRLKDPGLV